MSKQISDAANLLLEAARTGFGEPTGAPEHYRFSINGNQLEIMHSTRKPIEWVVIPISLAKE